MKNEHAVTGDIWNGIDINLCDFALFLSVIKNKDAHEITLSIIMENPNLRLDEIHVEEVILNNPDILIQDERIKRLNSVVTKVKEYEEWEVVNMSIYSVARSRGDEASKAHGEKIDKETILIEQICKKLRKAKSLEVIADELEVDVSKIKSIYQMATDFAHDYNTETVIAT